MSFTRIAPKPRDIKLRCHRCGKTRNVRPTEVGDLCGKCRAIEKNIAETAQMLADSYTRAFAK